MDNQIITLPLPDELDNPFFFSTNLIKVEKSSGFSTKNFIYEILFYSGIESYKPWENQLEVIPRALEEWRRVRSMLEDLYRKRDQKNSLHAMKSGIGLFIQILFWSNDLPVSLKEPITSRQFNFKPVNMEERLAFIISRPNLFHSFRQLDELMLEQEKLFVKKNIIRKSV